MPSKRSRIPKTKFGDQEFQLVQFLEDNAYLVVTSENVKKCGSTMKALWPLDKQYYSCLVQGKSCDKEELQRMKISLEKAVTGKKRRKSDPPVTSKISTSKKSKVAKKKVGQDEKTATEVNEKTAEAAIKKKVREEKEAQRLAKLKADNAVFKSMEESGYFALSDDDEDEEVPELPKEPHFDLSDSDEEMKSVDGDLVSNGNGVSETISPEQNLNAKGHPTQAGKCPRPEYRTCAVCPKYIQENQSLKLDIISLRKEVADLKVQLAAAKNSSVEENTMELATPPRPGRVDRQLAKMHKYVQLTPGDEIFVPPKLMTIATKKAKVSSPTACARFMVKLFYDEDELIHMNVKGMNGKEGIDPAIRSSIFAFLQDHCDQAIKESEMNSTIGNMITAMKTRSNRKK
ncbi:titin homolog [Ptychodera flava]|uniref:titin homolog n=1 Tax=Ptychodera flava TaxID=63121 RepID=UPI00396A2CFF